ncbi:MAG: hypothetical protein HY835_07235, partial [Anaerolineae bacterium]|nr:hypothetical protein [Anaerolineae bacterium]
FSGPVTAWWYDPRTGTSSRVGDHANDGAAWFQSPLGGPDWVLVLDVKSANYPPPGQV